MIDKFLQILHIERKMKMEKQINLELTQQDYKLIKGCLLTTKETLKCILFKTNDIKVKIEEIDRLLEKLD